MKRIPPKSESAGRASALVEGLQRRFVEKLEALVDAQPGQESGGTHPRFRPTEWLRDEGRHGGGVRFSVGETAVFNQASVNVSSVHYDDEPDRRLSSATAISTIIHPRNPRAPSVHIHISWTEMRTGAGYWRMMADLNPAIAHDDDKRRFQGALRAAAPAQYEEASAQGDRYFHIPALGRHRGVTHFYLESYATPDVEADRALAERVGQAAIDTYVDILRDALARSPSPSKDDESAQLAYHTVYLFQVLTLDRGTTSGLMVHDQNDVGILGSLPNFIDRALLASWESEVPKPQDQLVRALVAALPEEAPAHLTDEVRARLAQVVRAHYRAHPEALELQASGNVVPPTVHNHGRA